MNRPVHPTLATTPAVWWILAAAAGLAAGVLRGHAAAVPPLLIVGAGLVAAACLTSARVSSITVGLAVAVALLLTLDPARGLGSRIALAGLGGAVVGAVLGVLLRWRHRFIRHFAALAAGLALVTVPAAGGRDLSAHRVSTETPKTLNVDAAERYLRSEVDKGRLPGLAFGVSERGVPVRLVAFGTKGNGGRPMRPTTQLRIGSMSKSFTALTLAQLADQGSIALDDPIHRYLTWPEQSPVTVRQLLQHTSGIPNSAGWEALAGTNDIDRSITGGMSDVDLGFPGHAEYSNANYILAGQIIEALTGTDYATHLEAAVLAPLGLRDTTARRPTDHNRAEGYRFWYGVAVPSTAPFLDFAAPAGFITSNVSDLLSYIDAVIRPDSGRVPSSTQADLLRFDAAAPDDGPAAEPFPGHRYGLGWVQGNIAGIEVVWHSGGIADFNSVMVSDPDGDWAFVILINTASQVARLMPTITANVTAALHDSAPPSGSAARSLALTYVVLDLTLIAILTVLAISLTTVRRPSTRRRGIVYASAAFASVILVLTVAALPGATGFPVDRLSLGDQVAFSRVLRTYVPDVGWAALVVAAASVTVILHSTAAGLRRFEQSPHLGARSQAEADT